MRVMSFNVLSKDLPQKKVYGGEDLFTDARVSVRGLGLNAVLNGESVDIAGLQELSLPWRQWLTENLDGKYAAVGDHTKATGEAGYILYRKDKYEVLHSGRFWLAEGAPDEAVVGWDSKFDRLCVWALFTEKQNGKRFLFFDTHLDHIGVLARPRQASVIMKQIEKKQAYVRQSYGIENCPVILTGDMNSEPTTKTYVIYTSGLRDARVCSVGDTIEACYCTSPDFYLCESAEKYSRKGHIIDYIFVSENITVNSYSMVHTATKLCQYGEYISDHNAIFADVEF